MIPKRLHNSLRPFGTLYLALFALTLAFGPLTGCVVGSKPEPKPAVDVARTAKAMVLEGRLFEAADEYVRLSRESKQPQADIFVLEAATILVNAGDLSRARNLADAVGPNPRYPEVGWRKAIVNGSLALANNRPDEVLASLPPEQGSGIPPTILARGHNLRARAYERLREPLPAARSRILADQYLSSHARQRKNHQFIWRNLLAVSPTQLDETRRGLDPASDLAGWIELTEIWRAKLTEPDRLSAEIQSWTQRHPLNPANGEFVLELLEQSALLAEAPRKVALLLPFDGPFEQAAIFIRDGFAAAWFADADNRNRPQIMFLDTASDSIEAVYDQALEAQADFIVGPIRKDALAELLAAGPLPVPTLLLNRSPVIKSTLNADVGSASTSASGIRSVATDSRTDGNVATTTPLTSGQGNGQSPTAGAPAHGLGAPVYEFALNPEEEAARVAERAWFDGHARAAIIVPQGAWGERVAQAFTTAWETLGGMVVTTELYAADARDMSPAVSSLLNIDQSRDRAKALRTLLNRRIKHVPRRRHDMDMIFMAAFPTQARQLRPTFKFHQADEVPVYATSHLYDGKTDPAANLDLDGVIFGDMPWILHSEYPGISRTQIENLWPNRTPGLARLYAFGADAYALISRAGQLRAQSGGKFAGLSGRLGMDSENQVTRQLTWATFDEGLAHPLDVDSTTR